MSIGTGKHVWLLICFVLDHPMVISGNTVLMIDPHQQADKVNAMMDLKEMPSMSGINLDAFVDTLDGTFGFGRQCIDENYFPGTLFWFPLRETESDLSSTLYDTDKVLQLFEVFKEEANSVLIFLKSLSSVELYTRTGSEGIGLHKRGEIRILDEDGKVEETRNEFKTKLSNLSQNEDITFPIQLTIRTSFSDVTEERTWLVVNYVVGKSASPNFRKLIRDKTFGYSPCVGVAMCLEPSISVEGHIFCFLPLPKEGSRHTGLPVHVNGFFALNQNRHHLKWATDQQKGKTVDDKSILWNEKMITEALPRAYQQLILAAMEYSETKTFTDESVQLVYSLIPDSSIIVDAKWKSFVSKAMERLRDQRICYCQHSSSWVSIENAVFTTFDNLAPALDHVKTPVMACLSRIGKHAVQIDAKKVATLKTYFKAVTEISPSVLSTFLKKDAHYKDLDDDSKHAVLSYLLQDKDVKKIQDLDLLQLLSGEWIKFKRHGQVVYVAKEDFTIFPGLDDRFCSPAMLKHSSSLSSVICKGMFNVFLVSDKLFPIA